MSRLQSWPFHFVSRAGIGACALQPRATIPLDQIHTQSHAITFTFIINFTNMIGLTSHNLNLTTTMASQGYIPRFAFTWLAQGPFTKDIEAFIQATTCTCNSSTHFPAAGYCNQHKSSFPSSLISVNFATILALCHLIIII